METIKHKLTAMLQTKQCNMFPDLSPWISFRSRARASAVSQLDRKGSVPGRSKSGAPKQSSCSLKQQMLIRLVQPIAENSDTRPKM